NVYPASDGWVVINAPGDVHFRSILGVIERNDLLDDPRYATRGARVKHMLEVDGIIESWSRHVPKQVIADRLLSAGVPCAPVRDLAEVARDENMLARGSLQWVDHPTLGRVTLPHSPLRFEDDERRTLQPSHPLGADNRAVYGGWLGRTDDELDGMARDGVL